MRLLVCGSRHGFHEPGRIWREMQALGPLALVSGGGTGVDFEAESAARGMGLHIHRFHADWSLGPPAGPRRNARMLAEGKPDRGLAFGALWKRDGRMNDPEAQAPLWNGARSGGWKMTGAGGMVSLMLAAGLPVRWIASPNAAAIDLDGMPGPP